MFNIICWKYCHVRMCCLAHKLFCTLRQKQNGIIFVFNWPFNIPWQSEREMTRNVFKWFLHCITKFESTNITYFTGNTLTRYKKNPSFSMIRLMFIHCWNFVHIHSVQLWAYRWLLLIHTKFYISINICLQYHGIRLTHPHMLSHTMGYFIYKQIFVSFSQILRLFIFQIDGNNSSSNSKINILRIYFIQAAFIHIYIFVCYFFRGFCIVSRSVGRSFGRKCLENRLFAWILFLYRKNFRFYQRMVCHFCWLPIIPRIITSPLNCDVYFLTENWAHFIHKAKA